MKQFYLSSFRLLFIFCSLVLSDFITAADEPRWLKHLPKSQNDTYRYQVEYEVAESESVAYEKAYAKLVRSGIAAIGITCSAADANTAVNNGFLTDIEGTVHQLPIRAVCSYTQLLKGGGVKVYILGQVAVKSALALDGGVKFTEFRDCEYSASDSGELVEQSPTEWAAYKTDEYESSTAELDIDQDRLTCQHAIETQARQSLISKSSLKDTALHQLIVVKSHLGQKRAYAIAYIKRENILSYYLESARSSLEICDSWLGNVSTYIQEGKTGDAKALVMRTQKKMAEIDSKLMYLQANIPSPMFYRDIQGMYSKLKLQQDEALQKTQKGDIRQRESKIIEYVDLADKAINRNEVGNALRYLYAAQLLLADSPSSQYLQVGQVKAMVAIPEKIKRILAGVTVVCDGTLPGNKQELKLSFIYNKEPIMGINFMYNCNLGWSDFIATKNGWATALLPENNTLGQIHVMLDYRCITEANFDVELPELYEKYQSRFNYDEAAKKIVSIKLSNIAQPTTQQASSLAGVTTNVQENVVLSNVQKQVHHVSANDSAKYIQTILAACEALKANKNDWESLSPYFTERGHEQYKELLNYGKIRIISTEGCRFVRIGQEVQCRSIPVSFSFSKGKTQYENIVFTLLDPVGGKIDGVQFSLEERSMTNIMEDESIDETARLTLLNFMENYKTAFAFQDWDYVESIFSDDAIIITGRVIKRQETMADGRQTIINDYKLTKQSKEQYIKRLRATTKEWINIKFGSTLVERSSQRDVYGLSMSQDYYSNNYGDHGYLFLLIDNTDPQQPLIRIRAWQPNEHFDMGKFAELEQAHRNGKL